MKYLYKMVQVFEFNGFEEDELSSFGSLGYRIIYSEPILELRFEGYIRIGTGFVLEKVEKNDE